MSRLKVARTYHRKWRLKVARTKKIGLVSDEKRLTERQAGGYTAGRAGPVPGFSLSPFVCVPVCPVCVSGTGRLEARRR